MNNKNEKLYETNLYSKRIFYIPNKLFNSQFADVSKYKKLKDELNKYKSFMNNIDIKKYEKFNNNMDIYIGLKKYITNNLNGQAVSNAWLKMWEILTFYKILKKNDLVFCNAELPGAFISAINHFAQCNKNFPNMSMRWLACSYMNEQMNKDNSKLGDYYGIYSKNKEKWLMSEIYKKNSKYLTMLYNEKTLKDYNKTYLIGDLTDSFDIATISKLITIEGGANLYTSDAGLDLGGDYENQEEISLKLNYGQILCGLDCIKIGGNLITKQFTCLTLFNQSLINLLSLIFTEFYICKPLTSRPTNSEIYLIGINYKGCNFIKKLYDVLDNFDNYDNVNILNLCNIILSDIIHDDIIHDDIIGDEYDKSNSILSNCVDNIACKSDNDVDKSDNLNSLQSCIYELHNKQILYLIDHEKYYKNNINIDSHKKMLCDEWLKNMNICKNNTPIKNNNS